MPLTTPLGTAVVSQVAVWLLVLHVWARIFYATKFELFTAHPLLNSAALLFLVQSLLILQPTSTPAQKRYGTLIHSGLNALAFALFWAAFIIIIVNKEGHQGDHFGSPHSILGLIFYVLVFVQVVVGILQYYVPKAFGGPEKAKAIYKYHRISGYFILVVLLMTVCAAAWTTYNVNVIHIKNWAIIVTSALLLLSLLSRTRLSKFGIQGKSVRL